VARKRWQYSFGVVLVLLVLTMLVIALLEETSYGSALAVVMQAGSVLIIYRAANVSRRGMIFAMTVAGIAIAATVSIESLSDPTTATIVAALSLMTLLVLGPYVIARRLREFDHIGIETVFAALCIYLIVGMFFSVLYLFVGTLSPDPFFAEAGDPTAMDSLYFSFTTLTTLGYGDLTPAGDLGRMLAITEALLGQVYLVTVVALIVANLGREKKPTARRKESQEG
jgi:hypothetical protein